MVSVIFVGIKFLAPQKVQFHRYADSRARTIYILFLNEICTLVII